MIKSEDSSSSLTADHWRDKADKLKEEKVSLERKCKKTAEDLEYYRNKCERLQQRVNEAEWKIACKDNRLQRLHDTHKNPPPRLNPEDVAKMPLAVQQKLEHNKQTIEKLSLRIGEQLSSWKISSNEKDKKICQLQVQISTLQQCLDKLPPATKADLKSIRKKTRKERQSQLFQRGMSLLRSDLWEARKKYVDLAADQALRNAEQNRLVKQAETDKQTITKLQEAVEKLNCVVTQLVSERNANEAKIVQMEWTWKIVQQENEQLALALNEAKAEVGVQKQMLMTVAAKHIMESEKVLKDEIFEKQKRIEVLESSLRSLSKQDKLNLCPKPETQQRMIKNGARKGRKLSADKGSSDCDGPSFKVLKLEKSASVGSENDTEPTAVTLATSEGNEDVDVEN